MLCIARLLLSSLHTINRFFYVISFEFNQKTRITLAVVNI